MDSVQAQRALSERDLSIFTAELQRRSKSTGLAYAMWFFLGLLGIHQIYIGNVVWGVVYFALGVVGWAYLFQGIGVGILLLAVLGLFLLWDLFSIPAQLSRREERIKAELLARLGANG